MSINNRTITPRIDPTAIEETAFYRNAQVTIDATSLRRSPSDYESEQAYMDAMLKDYEMLRRKEYEYMVLNECTKVYNLAMDGGNNFHENDNVWYGYQDYINAAATAEERTRREQQVADSAISRSHELASLSFSGRKDDRSIQKGWWCCAITSASLVAQFSGKMGYDGEQNLIQGKKRGGGHARDIESSTNNIPYAFGIAKCESVPLECRYFPEPSKTLNQAILDGEIGIGDSVGLHTASSRENWWDAGNDGHAITIAAIEYGDDGSVKSYTYQCNNSRALVTVDPNRPTGYGGYYIANALNTGQWMDGKIGAEIEDLRNKSPEELRAFLEAQLGRTQGVITDLQATEIYGNNHGYNRGISARYNERYASLDTDYYHRRMDSLLNPAPISAPQQFYAFLPEHHDTRIHVGEYGSHTQDQNSNNSGKARRELTSNVGNIFKGLKSRLAERTRNLQADLADMGRIREQIHRGTERLAALRGTSHTSEQSVTTDEMQTHMNRIEYYSRLAGLPENEVDENNRDQETLSPQMARYLALRKSAEMV